MSVTETQTPQILFVDDEPDLQILLRQKFRKRIKSGEMTLFFALNGAEALAMLAENPAIDFVISDINMPVMDGLEFLSNLRADFPLVRAVMLSAYGDMDKIRSAMNRGAFDFLTKPIDFEDLDMTMQKTLSHVRDIKQNILSKRENDVMKDFVDEAWVTKLLDNADQTLEKGESSIERKGETIEASILFADICGFTAAAEHIPPEALVENLNRFFDVMVKEIIDEGGSVDKFMGDAVMAIFQGEDRLRRCFSAALQIHHALAQQPEMKSTSLNYQVKVAIGIDDGVVVYGPMGAAKAHRLDYTVIGNAVNLASRIESKASAGQTLLRTELAEELRSQYNFEDLGEHDIKGKTERIALSAHNA